MKTETPVDTLLTESQAALILGGSTNPLSTKTLQAWRATGRGPRYIKLGSGNRAPVRYRASDLQRFLAEGERNSTTDHSARGGK